VRISENKDGKDFFWLQEPSRLDAGQDVGGLGVELHHLLVDEGVLAALALELLPLLDELRVGQHLPVLRHLLDHSFVVALNWAVVLVDFDVELATGGEVVWLGQVAAQAVVLHGVQVVVDTDGVPLVLSVLLPVAGPDLLEVGHDVVTSFNNHGETVSRVLDEGDDLVVRHLEDLLAVDAPDVVPLLEVSLLCGAVGLDAAELDGEGLVLAADDDEAPGLAAGPLQVGGDHTLGHPHDQSLLAIH